MPLWGSADQANNSPNYTPAQLKLTPNTANRDALYGNTTADAFITNQTAGVFGVGADEIVAAGGKIAHTGWVLKTTGSGGRAGRVQHEVLVAGGFSSDTTVAGMPNTSIVISIQPASKSVNTNISTTLSVGAVTLPAGHTITYQWQANTGASGAWANLSNAGIYSNVTTSTMTISNTNTVNNIQYRAVLNSTGANTVNSDGATLIVT